MIRHLAFFAAVLAALTVSACKHAVPAGVAAEVNGHAITIAELEKIYSTQSQHPPEGASSDVFTSQKLDLLTSMITSEIMWQRAEKAGLIAVDADVETELNKMKAPFTKEEFEKKLADKHMTVEDLKAQLRRDLTVNKLINKEITSHISISDADVAGYYNANKAMFNLPEPRIHMAQILVSPDPNAEFRNLKNSKAKNDTEAKAKIANIEMQLRQGQDFNALAANYSEDVSSAPNGGDMGFLPESTLEKVSPDLRKVVMALQPGAISPVMRMPDGYRILKVISKEPAGQRDLNDPRVQQQIREELMNEKDSLLKAAYIEVARNGATIHNYFAQSIIDNAAKNK
ncbi:PpiC-type peptidyl-prolyl cis-trans isomerase [Candidatus Sulfopaludibacter sp. SbA3]|nr:PpiC-type peptidyl-prolyl cis-trans isomerase [Candidatus Sulfopaludibacter sp. SbA3]